MGYSAERQDQVQVVNVQFGFGPEETPASAVEAVAEQPKPWIPYLRYAVGGLLFLIILLFVVRPLIAMLGAPAVASETEAAAPALPASVGAVEASLASVPDRAQIIDMARKNPDTTAVVVKQWLKGGA
jgi:flagellar M-ring protein FliF